jgi:hypothetical protein
LLLSTLKVVLGVAAAAALRGFFGDDDGSCNTQRERGREGRGRERERGAKKEERGLRQMSADGCCLLGC